VSILQGKNSILWEVGATATTALHWTFTLSSCLSSSVCYESLSGLD